MPSWRADALSAIQLLSTPSETSSIARDAQPFAVERARTQPALAQRVVDDRRPPRANTWVAEPVLEEARFARHRRAADRAGEMAEQGRRHARVEQHRHPAGLGPRRIQPGDRPFPGEPADFLGSVEVLEVPRAVPRVVALHARAFAGDDPRRAAVAGRAKSAGETRRGGQCEGRGGCAAPSRRWSWSRREPLAPLARPPGRGPEAPPGRGPARRRHRGSGARRGAGGRREPGPHIRPRAPRRPSPSPARPARQRFVGEVRGGDRRRSSGRGIASDRFPRLRSG